MGKMYRIKKSYGKWSSSTVVEGPENIRKSDKTVSVYHPSTQESFEIPPNYLIAVRNRG